MLLIFSLLVLTASADGGYRYIVFDEESLSFKPSKTAEDSIFLYKEACAHPEDGWHYTPATEATCTEQGSAEYWYCDYCYNFFQNGDFDAPADLGEYHSEIYSKLTLKATGHDFNDEGVCERCSMKRPVYTQVSTLEQFDGLSEDAQYIIVIKDGEKTYAAYLPVTQNPCDTDSDGDGMVDALDVDENSNTIPDAFEELFEFEGIGDIDEDGDVDIDDYGVWVGDRDENGELDLEDYRIFLEEWYWNFVYMYDSRAAELSNFVELSSADPRISSYIHGDVIPVDSPAGIAALLCDGAPLGGGKISSGMLKNYYPKGLRE